MGHEWLTDSVIESGLCFGEAKKFLSFVFFVLTVLIGSAAVGDAESPTETDTIQRGYFTVTFTERSPLSAVSKQLDRFQWKGDHPQPKYKLSKESFNVYVPESMAADETFGLLVWCSASKNGAIHWPNVVCQAQTDMYCAQWRSLRHLVSHWSLPGCGAQHEPALQDRSGTDLRIGVFQRRP